MKYIANPVEVDAFVIQMVRLVTREEAMDDINRDFALVLDSGELVFSTLAMTSRMTPKIGDYWVIQADGYIYLNPKEVFERKYSPMVGEIG